MLPVMLRKFLAIVLIIDCYTSCVGTKKSHPSSETIEEGYIYLTIKFYADADSAGFPLNEMPVNDPGLLSVYRKMYLWGNLLIDMQKNYHFVNASYLKTDTLSYEFYNLAEQTFISFRSLSPNSKILKKGKMEANGGAFSNAVAFDPMSGVPDSAWSVYDTITNNEPHSIISFPIADIDDSLDRELSKRSKFWVNNQIKNFPLQLSYILSGKLNNRFVYKMQQPSPDGKFIMVTSLKYQPSKLPDTLKSVFRKWVKIKI